tara:strand:+ start:93 stop:629 length:537 start_codon:yes stop_codon:yes gene_type:complete
MKTENIERYMNSFGRQVVAQAKTTLNYKKGGDSKLEDSIKFKVIEDKEGFTLQFFMSSYGQYVDKGVSGTKQNRTFKNYKGKVIKSPYAYRNAKGHSQPPSSALDKWVVKKGIAPRDAKGRFIKRKTLTFLVARKIGRYGIQGISFFQKPLGLALEQFGKDLLGNVKEDIINSITTIK